METVAKSRLYPLSTPHLRAACARVNCVPLNGRTSRCCAPEQPDEPKQLLIHIRRTLVYATGRYREVALEANGVCHRQLLF